MKDNGDQGFAMAGGAKPTDEVNGAGHRERLRERFDRKGIEAFHAHEVVELILTYTIPRKDTKKIARTLLGRYRSIGALFNAPTDEIMKVSGIGKRSALHFRLIGEVLGYCLRERYRQQPVIAHQHDVAEYLRFAFGYRRDEYMAALYLGNRNQVIDTGVIAEGTVNHCTVYPRTIVEKALRHGAASIIVAHNHPGGSHVPSEADWQFTERLFEICRLLDIPLVDHLIVSAKEVVSLKMLSRWPGNSGKTRP